MRLVMEKLPPRQVFHRVLWMHLLNQHRFTNISRPDTGTTDKFQCALECNTKYSSLIEVYRYFRGIKQQTEPFTLLTTYYLDSLFGPEYESSTLL
jgi:hypothetical protein